VDGATRTATPVMALRREYDSRGGAGLEKRLPGMGGVEFVDFYTNVGEVAIGGPD